MKLKVKPIDKIDLSCVANRDQERQFSKASDGKRKIPLSSIFVIEGFNLRNEEDFDPVELEEMADSLVAIGMQQQPKVILLPDGSAGLIDGERRIRSAHIASARSPELKKRFAEIECILAPKGCSSVDRLVMMLSTQSQKHFAPFREAEGYKKLRDGYMGDPPLTITEIATRLSKPVAFVEQRLILADESDEMKDLAKSNKVKATTVVHLNRVEKDPVKRVQKVKEANEKGKRLQGKDILNAPGVYLLDEAHSLIDEVLNNHGIVGEAMNILLDVQSKLLAIKNIIQ